MFWRRFYWGEGRWTQERVVYTTRTHFSEKRDGRGCSNITDAHVRNSREGGKGISGSDQQNLQTRSESHWRHVELSRSLLFLFCLYLTHNNPKSLSPKSLFHSVITNTLWKMPLKKRNAATWFNEFTSCWVQQPYNAYIRHIYTPGLLLPTYT